MDGTFEKDQKTLGRSKAAPHSALAARLIAVQKLLGPGSSQPLRISCTKRFSATATKEVVIEVCVDPPTVLTFERPQCIAKCALATSALCGMGEEPGQGTLNSCNV